MNLICAIGAIDEVGGVVGVELDTAGKHEMVVVIVSTSVENAVSVEGVIVEVVKTVTGVGVTVMVPAVLVMVTSGVIMLVNVCVATKVSPTFVNLELWFSDSLLTGRRRWREVLGLSNHISGSYGAGHEAQSESYRS